MNEPKLFTCDLAGCTAFPEIAMTAAAAGGHVYLGTLCNAVMLALG